MERISKAKLPSSLLVENRIRLPVADECVYVNGSRSENGSSSCGLYDKQTAMLRNSLDVSVKCGSVPPPVLSFSSCRLPVKLLQNIESVGYEVSTPVQMQAIPAALNGSSLFVSAERVSGKTALYLIPIIAHCVNSSYDGLIEKKSLVMVLTPTRELCVQVEEEAKLLGKGLPFKTALVTGGDAMASQTIAKMHSLNLREQRITVMSRLHQATKIQMLKVVLVILFMVKQADGLWVNLHAAVYWEFLLQLLPSAAIQWSCLVVDAAL